MSLPSVVIRFAGTDQTCAVMAGTIRHGRGDAVSQPAASVASLDLYGPIPSGVTIGTPVTVVASLGGVEFPRFAGRVTDLGVAFDDVDHPVPQLIAAGALGDMGRRIIGDTPWPSERDGDRANRVIGLAGVPTDAARTDRGVWNVLARDVDAQPALDVATDAAIAGLGLVWQARDGAVLYADADHRKNSPVSLELAACDLPVSLAWAQTLEGLANDVRVRYGVASGGGDQPEVHKSSPSSIAALGTFGASISTTLADATAADERAQYVLNRQSFPTWVVGGLSFPFSWLGPELCAQLLGLEVHALVSLTGLPIGAPVTSALLWVEGWTERIDAGDAGVGEWTLELVTSDYCSSASMPRWDEVDPATTWDSVPPALTWDAAVCMPPYPSRGRWNDTPASLRWDGVDAGVTWDTWAG